MTRKQRHVPKYNGTYRRDFDGLRMEVDFDSAKHTYVIEFPERNMTKTGPAKFVRAVIELGNWERTGPSSREIAEAITQLQKELKATLPAIVGARCLS